MTSLTHSHTRNVVRLSLPLIATQIGQVVTGMVDNIFLGRLGKTEQGAGILSNNLFMLLLVFSIGLSYALTPLTTDAHVAKDEKQKAALFKNGVWLNLFMSLVLFAILYFASPLMHHMRQDADVIELAVPFFNVLIFSIIPVSLFFACKQYCEGLSNTRAAMYISVVGNLLNILLNYLLIYGKWGLPEMGYMGSCWATFIARCVMGIAFLVYVLNHKSLNSFRPFLKQVKLNMKDTWELFRMGIGFALQSAFEVAAFSLAGIMSGAFGKESLDAHGIALHMAAFTFMFGMGISGAATIVVSNLVALNDRENLRLAIKSIYKLIIIVMVVMALVFVCFHPWLPQIFSNDADIIRISANLLLFAAMFQLFDGTQVIALGILRGLEDVRYPTAITFFGYWLIALPLAYFLGFVWKLEVYGIWIALSLSLLFVSVCLYFRIRYLINKKHLR